MAKVWGFASIIGLLICAPIQAYPKEKIIASDGYTDDYFGRSVAIDGDMIVVGAYSADNNGSNSGTVYVYTRNGSTWVETELPAYQQQTPGEGVGFSVAIDGDTVVAGAPYGNAVYVYTHSGSTWSLQQKLTKSDGAFGCAVAIDGDTLIAGASVEDVWAAGDEEGAAYIYTRSGSTWTQQKRLTAPSASSGPTPYYGCSVGIDGDTVVVGAYRYCYTGTYSGSAYVYTGSGSSWSIQGDLASLAGTDPTQGLEAGDYFGWSVDIDDNTVLVGAYRDGGVDSVGAAYAFVRSGSTWSKQQKLFASNAGSGGTYFGCGVSLLGDRAVIGSYYDEIDGSVLGSAHTFNRSGSLWTEDISFTEVDIANGDCDVTVGDLFGYSVALGDSFAAVGSFKDHNDNGTDAGAAYVYNLILYPKVFNEFQVNTFTEDDQTNPSIAFGPDGNFVVVWNSHWQDNTQSSIYAQKYNPYGIRIDESFRVNQVFAGSQFQSDVLSLPDGCFVFIWISDGVYARKFDSNCNPITDDILVSVSDESKSHARLAVYDNCIMIVWDNWVVDTSLPANGLHHVKARLLDLSLVSVTPEITVSENYISSPIVKADGLGNFIVAWSTFYDKTICMKKYNLSGIQIGNEKVLGYSGYWEEFSINPHLNGNFLFVTTQGGLMNFNSTVIAQKYNSDGDSVAAEIMVCNSYMYKRGIESCLLSNGNFLVTWYGQLEGDDYDIYFREFDENGVAVNSESIVNSNNGGSKWAARPATGLNGKYAITWRSTDQDGDEDGIFAAIGPKTYLGDFDFDQRVNFFDFQILAEGWLNDEPVLDIAPEGGDGVINLLDFSVFAEQWF